MRTVSLSCIEERLNAELYRRKKVTDLEKTKTGQVVNANEELRKINTLIQSGYVHKENLALIKEHENEMFDENVV